MKAFRIVMWTVLGLMAMIATNCKPKDANGPEVLDAIKTTYLETGKTYSDQLFSYQDNRLDKVTTLDFANSIKDPSNNYFHTQQTHQLFLIRVMQGGRSGTYTFSYDTTSQGITAISSCYSLHLDKLTERQMRLHDAKGRVTSLIINAFMPSAKTAGYDSACRSREIAQTYTPTGQVMTSIMTYYSGSDSLKVSRRYQYDDKQRLIKAEEQFEARGVWYPLSEVSYHPHLTPFGLPDTQLQFPQHEGGKWLIATERQYSGGILIKSDQISQLTLEDGHIRDLVRYQQVNNNLGQMVGDKLRLLFTYRASSVELSTKNGLSK